MQLLVWESVFFIIIVLQKQSTIVRGSRANFAGADNDKHQRADDSLNVLFLLVLIYERIWHERMTLQLLWLRKKWKLNMQGPKLTLAKVKVANCLVTL